MPSPLGHAIAGLTVHVATARDEAELSEPRRIGVVTLAALAPDVDFLFRLFDGRNHHQQETHSLGFAVLAALGCALAFRLARRPRPLATAAAVGLAWLSHVMLDYLNNDSNPPIGLMALWPLSRDYYKFPWPIFLDIGRSLSWATVRNNLLAAAWETVVLLPLFALAWRLRRQRLGRGRS
jgi:membrane-bound metal-dependent hydrolase YbcI (DUF457 family)